MKFGRAIEALKEGRLLRRESWEEPEVHLYMEKDRVIPKWYTGVSPNRLYAPVICMYTKEHTHSPGWIPSQADMVAEDWVPV